MDQNLRRPRSPWSQKARFHESKASTVFSVKVSKVLALGQFTEKVDQTGKTGSICIFDGQTKKLFKNAQKYWKICVISTFKMIHYMRAFLIISGSPDESGRKTLLPTQGIAREWEELQNFVSQELLSLIRTVLNFENVFHCSIKDGIRKSSVNRLKLPFLA